MTADHLGLDPATDFVNAEEPLLGGDLRDEDDLEEQITELRTEHRGVATRDRIHDLIGLLDGVGGDGGEVLLQVPGTAAVRGQPPDQQILVLARACRP